MNIVFLIALGIYLLFFILMGYREFKQIHDFDDYTVAGRKQGLGAVVMTLLATVIGASTTIGITDTVNSIGFPGIWWLLFGGIGLILQACFISVTVRKTDAATLPDLAGITVGKAAEYILALIIVISWIGVIAGQLVAMGSLIVFATGRSSKAILIIVSIIVIIYTLFGGQLSVIKTDRAQLIVISIGVILACIYLYLVRGGDTSEIAGNIELINENYRPANLLTQFFVIGGVYFLGPDIMSRNFVSKSEGVARRSALVAGILLMVYSFIITMIGMWVRYNVTPDEMGENSALMYVVSIMPKALSIILIFGLLSAILSSTDTCLINAASILTKDILRSDSIRLVRIMVLLIGGIATVLAVMGRKDIMSLLSGAYSIYTPGVIFPMTVAILVYKKKDIRKGMWLLAVAVGGIVGIISTYFPAVFSVIRIPETVQPYMTVIGMCASLIIALLSVRWTKKSIK